MLTHEPPNIASRPPGAATAQSQNQVQPRAAGAQAQRSKSGFSSALQQFQAQAGAALTVQDGDTLIAIVRAQAQGQGLRLSASQELQLAHQLASANQIRNPDLILSGQKIQTASLQQEWAALQQSQQSQQSLPAASARSTDPTAAPAALTLARRPGLTERTRAPLAAATRSAPASLQARQHPVLEGTLVRAVAKGFIPEAEKVAVYNKIVQMAQAHKFAPDDFARMTLMESDGMNPRASNQRCHGIIQFCDGPARGAASSGYSANPRAILDLSVHQQLDLVDKYFADVGLKNQGPAGLEDLYLSVLNPASRSEAVATTPLNIQGRQSRLLHTDADRAAPITRQSIRQGLLQNAATRLGQWLPESLRPAQQRAQHYVKNQTS